MREFTKVIETDRLILRKFTIEDAENVYNNYASRSIVTRYLTWKPHALLQDTYSYLENIVLPKYENENEYRWAIVLKEKNQVIGCIDVVNKNIDKKSAELGYVLSDDYWGQGIMPEAGKAVIPYLFDEGFVRVWAIHDVQNPNSGKVMQKIGMTHEGTLKKYALDNSGNLIDCEIYAIIKN